MGSSGFGFGIETEYLLVRRKIDEISGAHEVSPLWIHDLDAEDLMAICDGIDTKDFNHDGLNQKPLHNSIHHYLIEGYTISDEEMTPLKILPKGIEARTPIFDSIEKSVECMVALHDRLNLALEAAGMSTAIISHHPTECEFDAPRNYRRDDYWHWARTVTATYGSDFNISVPDRIAAEFDLVALDARVNYYMPALIALSLSAPIFKGQLWQADLSDVEKGGRVDRLKAARSMPGRRIGKSIRTFRRSECAPAFYIHEKPSLRFEFKGFEMSRDTTDYHGYFLLCLALLLDETLEGKATDKERIESLRDIAVTGLQSATVRARAAIVIDRAAAIGQGLGMDVSSLDSLWRRLETRRLPAEEIIQTFELSGGNMSTTLKSLHGFVTTAVPVKDKVAVAASASGNANKPAQADASSELEPASAAQLSTALMSSM